MAFKSCTKRTSWCKSLSSLITSNVQSWVFDSIKFIMSSRSTFAINMDQTTRLVLHWPWQHLTWPSPATLMQKHPKAEMKETWWVTFSPSWPSGWKIAACHSLAERWADTTCTRPSDPSGNKRGQIRISTGSLARVDRSFSRANSGSLAKPTLSLLRYYNYIELVRGKEFSFSIGVF